MVQLLLQVRVVAGERGDARAERGDAGLGAVGARAQPRAVGALLVLQPAHSARLTALTTLHSRLRPLSRQSTLTAR